MWFSNHLLTVLQHNSISQTGQPPSCSAHTWHKLLPWFHTHSAPFAALRTSEVAKIWFLSISLQEGCIWRGAAVTSVTHSSPGLISLNWLARQEASSFRNSHVLPELLSWKKNLTSWEEGVYFLVKSYMSSFSSLQLYLTSSWVPSCKEFLKNSSPHSFLPSLNSYCTWSLSHTI